MKVCPRCGDFLEYAGEGIDPQGHLYDLYLCIECGYEQANPQNEAQRPPSNSHPWDPPDGYRSGN
ncbi:MAG: hypothetical protein K8L99_03660 [Anaerolineae bacterium]|nr:hypothetical protein [Anaerolineae bacterium]